MGGGTNHQRRLSPPEGVKLHPFQQKQFVDERRGQGAGKVYKDDIGNCWPAGLPVIMTRVWPIATIQLPTAIYMVSGFINSIRIIYLDGRPHTDPDILVPSFIGESIGHSVNHSLVIHPIYFLDDTPWLVVGFPLTAAFHIIQFITLLDTRPMLTV